jgi:hypothetical protein
MDHLTTGGELGKRGTLFLFEQDLFLDQHGQLLLFDQLGLVKE